MFTLYIKEPCNPDCDCRKEGKKKQCRCQQTSLLEMPVPEFPRR